MMKKNNRSVAIAEDASATTVESSNGHQGTEAPDLAAILECLQTLRDGEFSVRLPVSWVGLPGKLADTFNDIAAAKQQMGRERKRMGRVVGHQGETREPAGF